MKQAPKKPTKKDLKVKKKVSGAKIFMSREAALKYRKEKGGTVAIDQGSYMLYIFPNGKTMSVGKPVK